MASISGENTTMDKKAEDQLDVRVSYQAPELRVFGDIAQLTQGAGNGRGDSNGRTKT
jgi:hypothetical protein